MVETACEFIKRKKAQYEKERDRLYRYKDIGRRGHNVWRREAWTFKGQDTLQEKVFSIERLCLDGQDGDVEHRSLAGAVHYRFGYWIVGRIGNRNGKWTWGQFALLVPVGDLRPLLDLAVREGTIRAEDMPRS